MAKRSTSRIPRGPYCYRIVGPTAKPGGAPAIEVCPYWSKRKGKPSQMDGHCAYMGVGDWEGDGIGLLWDQVKECGVKED